MQMRIPAKRRNDNVHHNDNNQRENVTKKMEGGCIKIEQSVIRGVESRPLQANP